MKRSTRTAGVLAITGVLATGCGDGSVETGERKAPPALAVAALPAVPIEPALDAPKLCLRLARGDRFPVLKTVRQTIVQGQPASRQAIEGISKLEILMAVTVEETEVGGRTRMRVDFERISYRQDAGGQRFEFDSSRPAAALPAEAAVYAAMAGDGFSFWIGTDNRISERVDFDEFLDRSLAGVPPADRAAVTNRIAETSGDENIANFIDDSVGLLPLRANHGSTAAAGDTWRRERRIVRPVRLFVTEDCTLARLEEQTAAIDVNGTIGASETFELAGESMAGAEVRVAGGHSIGSCRVDRATGLPLESRIERLVKLRVRSEQGVEFDQLKRVETTIRVFPRRGRSEPAA